MEVPAGTGLAGRAKKIVLMVWSEVMKRAGYYLIGLSWLAVPYLWAGSVPRGSMLELHSCELYAGGCVVSSEATQRGQPKWIDAGKRSAFLAKFGEPGPDKDIYVSCAMAMAH